MTTQFALRRLIHPFSFVVAAMAFFSCNSIPVPSLTGLVPHMQDGTTYQGSLQSGSVAVRSVMSQIQAVETSYSESGNEIQIDGTTKDGKPLHVTIEQGAPGTIEISVAVNRGISLDQQMSFHGGLAGKLTTGSR